MRLVFLSKAVRRSEMRGEEWFFRFNPFVMVAKILRGAGHAMLGVTITLYIVSVYTVDKFILGHWASGDRSALSSVVAFLLLNGLAAMGLWSYFTVVATDPGEVPGGWHPFANDAQAMVAMQRLQDGTFRFRGLSVVRPRWCKHCQVRW